MEIQVIMEGELNLEFIPSKQDICLMCHMSSECQGCCTTCKDPCNSGQICGLKQSPKDQADRWETWQSIIKSTSEFKKLYQIMKPISGSK